MWDYSDDIKMRKLFERCLMSFDFTKDIMEDMFSIPVEKRLILPQFDSNTEYSYTELYQLCSQPKEKHTEESYEKESINRFKNIEEMMELFLKNLKSLIVYLNESNTIKVLEKIRETRVELSEQKSKAIGYAYRELIASTGAFVMINGIKGLVEEKITPEGKEYNIKDLLDEAYTDFSVMKKEYKDLKNKELNEKELTTEEKKRLEEISDFDNWVPNDDIKVMGLISNLGYLGSYYFFKTKHHFDPNNQFQARNYAKQFDIIQNRGIENMRDILFSTDQESMTLTFNDSWRLLIYPMLRAINDELHFYMKRAEILKDLNRPPKIFQLGGLLSLIDSSQRTEPKKEEESKTEKKPKREVTNEYLKELDESLKEKCIILGKIARDKCKPLLKGFKTSLAFESKRLWKRSFLVPCTTYIAWIVFKYRGYIKKNDLFDGDTPKLTREHLSFVEEATLYPAYHFEFGSRAMIQGNDEIRFALRKISYKFRPCLSELLKKVRKGVLTREEKFNKDDDDDDEKEERKDPELLSGYLRQILPFDCEALRKSLNRNKEGNNKRKYCKKLSKKKRKRKNLIASFQEILKNVFCDNNIDI